MDLDLCAGIPVSDYELALAWYERLLGSAPSFVAGSTEAVWELAEHRSVFDEERVEHAGHAMHTTFVHDLDSHVAQIALRGVDPVEHETYSNGARKVTLRDLLTAMRLVSVELPRTEQTLGEKSARLYCAQSTADAPRHERMSMAERDTLRGKRPVPPLLPHVVEDQVVPIDLMPHLADHPAVRRARTNQGMSFTGVDF